MKINLSCKLFLLGNLLFFTPVTKNSTPINPGTFIFNLANRCFNIIFTKINIKFDDFPINGKQMSGHMVYNLFPQRDSLLEIVHFRPMTGVSIKNSKIMFNTTNFIDRSNYSRLKINEDIEQLIDLYMMYVTHGLGGKKINNNSQLDNKINQLFNNIHSVLLKNQLLPNKIAMTNLGWVMGQMLNKIIDNVNREGQAIEMIFLMEQLFLEAFNTPRKQNNALYTNFKQKQQEVIKELNKQFLKNPDNPHGYRIIFPRDNSKPRLNSIVGLHRGKKHSFGRQSKYKSVDEIIKNSQTEKTPNNNEYIYVTFEETENENIVNITLDKVTFRCIHHHQGKSHRITINYGTLSITFEGEEA